MRNPQLPGDVARPNAVVSQLHYSLPYNVRQRPAVDKNATQLVHTTMALNNKTVRSLTGCQTSRHYAIFEAVTTNDNISTTSTTAVNPSVQNTTVVCKFALENGLAKPHIEEMLHPSDSKGKVTTIPVRLDRP
jgi:hypothetical protein